MALRVSGDDAGGDVGQSPSEKSVRSGEASEEDHHGCGVEEGSCRGEGRFRILLEASVATDPGEEPFNDPLAWMNSKANLIRRIEHEGTPIRVDQRLALAALDLLAVIVAARPPLSVVLTLWLSSTAGDGEASRPTRSRSAMTRE